MEPIYLSKINPKRKILRKLRRKKEQTFMALTNNLRIVERTFGMQRSPLASEMDTKPISIIFEIGYNYNTNLIKNILH